MGRAETLTRHLKRYDAELYAENGQPTGSVWVLRRNRSRPHEPHFIFALTDDWTAKGKPREWGIEPVLNRLKAIDLWKSGDSVIDRILADYEKAEESERRASRNSIESFLLEFRKPFARATNGINTSLLSKTDKRRQGDLKYGHRK